LKERQRNCTHAQGVWRAIKLRELLKKNKLHGTNK